MWRCVGLVRTYVSEIRIASILGVERISELGTTLAVTSYAEDGIDIPLKRRF
jgi:hypothetical protein